MTLVGKKFRIIITSNEGKLAWNKIFFVIFCILLIFAILYFAFYQWIYLLIQTHVPEDDYPFLIKLAYKLEKLFH